MSIASSFEELYFTGIHTAQFDPQEREPVFLQAIRTFSDNIEELGTKQLPSIEAKKMPYKFYAKFEDGSLLVVTLDDDGSPIGCESYAEEKKPWEDE